MNSKTDLYDATDKVKRVARMWAAGLTTATIAHFEGCTQGATRVRIKKWAKRYPEWFKPRESGDGLISLL